MATIAKIQKSSGIRYKAIIKHDGRILKTKTFTRKTDAKAWAKGVEADQERLEALDTAGAVMTLATLIDEYMIQYSGKDRSIHGSMAFWRRYLGAKKLIDITTREIRELLNGYAEGRCNIPIDPDKKATRKPGPRAPATVNRMKAAISSLLSYARREGHINRNPAQAVASRTENNQIVRWLSDDERERLLEACKASPWPRLYPLVVMALTTGARRGELLKLTWSDIDFDKGLATCRDTKNGDNRLLPLPQITRDTLKPFRGVGSALVFPSERKPRKPMEFRKLWNNALAQAGIENFRFHDLRHSAASYLVMGGATLHETAEVLGHRSIQTTKRYAHLSTDHKAALTERLLGKL